MRLGAVTQQPNELLSYTVWYNHALVDEDEVLSASITADPVGEIIVSGVSTNTDRVQFWVTGGLSGVRYTLTVSMTTTEGRIYEDELIFLIREI